jgi:hypothetical protein
MAEQFIEEILAESNPPLKGDSVVVPPVVVVPSSTEEGKSLESDLKDVTPVKDAEVPSSKNIKSEASIESLATQLGWRSDYAGENSVDAATYILKSREIQDSLKEHNKDLKKQLTNVSKSIDSLKEHNEKVYKTEVKRMQNQITELTKQKKSAIEVADIKKVEEIDQQIESLKEDITDAAPKEVSSENLVFDEWVKDNQWYLTDSAMADYAETVAQKYLGAPLEKIYKIVREKVVEVFPEKFTDSKKSDTTKDLTAHKTTTMKPIGPASPVESSTTKVSSSKLFTEADLTSEQATIMKQFVQSGVMTKEQYIKDIASMREE